MFSGSPCFNNRINEALACSCNPNSALRFLNDVTATWKVTDALTLITDVNYIHDDGFNTSGYGVAQYAVYKVTDWLSVVGRAEVWRDNGFNSGLTHTGFFVGGFPGNFDFVNAEYGFVNSSFVEAANHLFGADRRPQHIASCSGWDPVS